jgi:hypothetical protein
MQATNAWAQLLPVAQSVEDIEIRKVIYYGSWDSIMGYSGFLHIWRLIWPTEEPLIVVINYFCDASGNPIYRNYYFQRCI